MPTDTVRVALYTRVSTDVQAQKDEGSLDTQEARLKAFMASRPGDHVVKYVCREEGASGKSLDRPALRDLMRAIENNEIDLVLVTRLDRLSRSLLDFYELHRLFEKHNVRFVSLNETFDTSSPVGRAMLKLVLVFAELEREQTADRTRVALQARAERGLWNGGAPPLGYDSEGNGHLTVNAHEAELVRQVFDKYLELRSAPAVARWLNEQGHRQKRFASRRKGETGGKPFTPATMRQMIQNRLYIGEITHKEKAYKGQHDAIVTVDVFERAQGVIEGNAKNRRGPPLRAQHEYPLTGVTHCCCGYAMTTSAGTGQNGTLYFYYRCVGMNTNVDHACEVKQVNAEVLEDAVFGIVRDAARNPELLDAAVATVNRLAGESVAPVRARVDALRRELAAAEDEGRRVLRQVLTTGVGDSEFARTLLTEIEDCRNGLRQAVAREEGELAARESEQLDKEMLAQAIRGFDTSFDKLTAAEKREFLQLLIYQVTVHPGRVDVELFDGVTASRFLEALRWKRAAAEASDGNGHDAVKQFVADQEWLPLSDLNGGPSD